MMVYCFVCGKAHQEGAPLREYCIYRKKVICTECLDEEFPSKKPSSGSVGAPGRSDREYHGGQFNRGEW